MRPYSAIPSGLLLISILCLIWHTASYHDHAEPFMPAPAEHSHSHMHTDHHHHSHVGFWSSIWNLLQHPVHPDQGEDHLEEYLLTFSKVELKSSIVQIGDSLCIALFVEKERGATCQLSPWSSFPDCFDPPDANTNIVRGPPACA